MTYPDSNRLPVNRKLLTRLFNKIKVSTERFYEGVPCWEWQASKDKDGYGKSSYTHSLNKRKHYRTHRLFYDLFVCIVPDHLVIDHLCRNVSCCNPTHLDPVTSAENTRRHSVLTTHCPRGHEYSPQNCLPRSNGKRDCRICANYLHNLRRQRRKALGLPPQ